MRTWSRRLVLVSGAAALLVASARAWPHATHVPDAGSGDTAELLSAGLPIIAAGALYAAGFVRLRRRARSSRSRAIWMPRTLAFGIGLAFLVLALLSPLDEWGSQLFSLHMVQHELLMLAAAPLLVLGRPLAVFLWAFPDTWRGALGAAAQNRCTRVLWRALTFPVCAWILHALALWIWHAPVLFDAALRNTAVHDLQHASFLAGALLFWTALFQERRAERQGAAIVYLFTTTVHSSALGALLTFAARPWYAGYAHTTSVWGFSALEDQQLGGLIMWVPASLVYVGAALVLFSRWLRTVPA